MDQRRRRAVDSLRGVQVGDGLGERFFGWEDEVVPAIEARRVPQGRWRWTDDTLQACSVVEVLHRSGCIDQDALAHSLARRLEVDRGYGWATRELLHRVKLGEGWRELAPAQFEGAGSHGNGAAMRVTPVGAWFADDLDSVVREAAASAAVTHTHPDGVAGAIAVAVGAAIAVQTAPPEGAGPSVPSADEAQQAQTAFLTAVADVVPASAVRERILAAVELPADTDPREVALQIGSGQEISAVDTVAFALWCAGRSLDDFEETFWTTVAGLGDRDTTCAMACGIVAARLGADAIPPYWLAQVEPLPVWLDTALTG